jgi:hypothetical protein
MQDAAKKGRLGTPEQCAHYGEDNGNSKLTAEDVLAIRRAIDTANTTSIRTRGTMIFLRDKYGMSQTALWRVGKRMTWRSIPEAM